jgi:Kdo2-lipid IVA lauroyltransferase/acyltransferase
MMFYDLSSRAYGRWRPRLLRLKPRPGQLPASSAFWLLKLLRHANLDRMAQLAGWFLRVVGRMLPEHRTGRTNLRSAFPEKSAAEIDTILSGVWDNLGRVAAEFGHLDRLWPDPAQSQPGRIEVPAESERIFLDLHNRSSPALFFGAHLANWELPAVALAAYGIQSAIVYRPPSLRAVDETVRRLRAGSMGELIAASRRAPFQIVAALKRGLSVGMLVDQHFGDGVDVAFFGRACKANPLLARLARRFECPIHGIHVTRLPRSRFRVSITQALKPPRDAQGKVDVAGTMQAITSVVEGWVREHPEQWLWVHRRWR